MRIDSAILSNAIITASSENPIVSGSAQVNITSTTGYSTFSSSIKTYADAKVAGIVNSAPATLDTLDELAAALGDDANMSASFATTLATKLPTATHTAFSSSNASAIRTEYTAGDSALSASAHSDRVAKINVLSGSAHTQRAAIDAKISALDSTYATDASVSSLSASAHTRREQISASLDATIDALDSLGISTDTERGALSSSAHTQREAIKGLATTANNSLSSSTAAALRTEYVAGDSALSASAHTRRNELHALQLLSSSVGATINDNAVKLSGIESGATADQSNAEIRAAVEAASDSNVFTDADHSKLNAIEASADVTDATNVAAAGALMSSSLGGTINDNVVKLAGIEAGATADQSDEEIQDIVGAMVTGNTESGITVTYQDGDGTIDFSVASQTDENFTTADHAKLDGIEAGADVTDATNVTAAGALMDSELTSIADVKALDQSVIAGASPSFGTANMTDASNKRFMTDAQETKLDSVETNADVTDTTNVTAAGALMDSELTNLAAVKAINQALTTTSSPTFASGLISNDFTINGNLTVQGDTIQANVATLNIEDKNLLIASGAADSAAADGAGITIDGANEDITWDHGNSRFNFSDDIHVVGNITVSGNVDGRDVATDGSKLDGIESGATADQTQADINGLAITTVGTVSSGTWQGTAIADAYIASAATWNAIDTAVPAIYDNSGTPAFNTGITKAEVLSILNVEDGADVTDSTNVVAALTAGSNITISAGGEISSTDTNTTYSVGDGGLTENNFTNALKTKLDGIEASADVTDTTNVVAALTAGTNVTISAGGEISSTDTNTTYSVGDGGLTENNFTDALKTKLDGIATSANNYSISSDNGSNVHFEGLMIGQTTGATANTIRCVGDIVAYYSSDSQFKDNVEQLEGALDKVKQIRGVRFDWNDKQDVHEGHDIGVIAQEVEAVLPELVHERDYNNSKAVDYVKLTAVLIEAVKELSAKVEELSK